MRLFASLRPPAAALSHLQHALDGVDPVPLDGGPPPLRWVPPEQRHVTLAFYGEVPDGALDDLAGALAGVAAATSPMQVQVAGAGVFSKATLWMGVRALDDGLVRLMTDVEAAGEGISRMEPRDRRRAHLTVARLSAREQREVAERRRRSRRRDRRPATPAVDLSAIAHALSVYRGPVWEAREIELVQSRLGAGRSGGPQHELLATIPLGVPGEPGPGKK